mgnify:CR=1 FL=1|jgi:hypothetical protein
MGRSSVYVNRDILRHTVAKTEVGPSSVLGQQAWIAQTAQIVRVLARRGLSI